MYDEILFRGTAKLAEADIHGTLMRTVVRMHSCMRQYDRNSIHARSTEDQVDANLEKPNYISFYRFDVFASLEMPMGWIPVVKKPVDANSPLLGSTGFLPPPTRVVRTRLRLVCVMTRDSSDRLMGLVRKSFIPT